MTKMSIDLLGAHQTWLLAPSLNVVGFSEDIAEHVLNLLLQVLNISFIIWIGCIKDLLPLNLVGALKMEFKLGEEYCSIVPRH
jgi:hypothetical protein